MSTQAIEAGRAFVKLLVDDKDFASSLKGSLQKLSAFSSQSLRAAGALAGVGATITAPFAIATKLFTQAGGELQTLSQRTGITAQSLSELKFAAEQSGASLETIGRAAKEMQKNGLDPRTFDSVIASISKIADPVQRAQAMFSTFGKAGAELIPMLGNLEKLRAEARNLQLTMDPEAASAAEALGNAMNALKLQSQALSAAIGSAVAPSLKKAAEWLQLFNSHAIQFIKFAPGLVSLVAGLGAAISGIASGLAALSSAAKGVEVLVGLTRAVGPFLAANPWVAVALVAIPIIIGLGALVVKVARDLLGYTDASRKAAEGVMQHANAEAELRQNLEATQRQLEARAEAAKRLYGDKDAAAKESAVQGEMRRFQASDALQGIGPFTRIDATISQLNQRLVALQMLTEQFATGNRSRFDMTLAGAMQNETRKLEIGNIKRQLTDLYAQRFMSDPAALASAFMWPLGAATGASLKSDVFRGYNSGNRRGRGLPGFASPEQVLNDLVPGVSGPRGTFSGQLATQIFGGNGSLPQRLTRLQQINEKMQRSLESIDRKIGLGPAFKVGVA